MSDTASRPETQASASAHARAQQIMLGPLKKIRMTVAEWRKTENAIAGLIEEWEDLTGGRR